MSIKAGNSVEVSSSRSGIGSRANICHHQEDNTMEASIIRSGIDSGPICMSINISGLVKLVSLDTL